MPPTKHAEFTTNRKRPIVCQWCHESFDDRMKLFYMQDKTRDNPGKHVCTGCCQYYLCKTEAIQQSAMCSSPSPCPVAKWTEVIIGNVSGGRQITPGAAALSMSAQVDIRKAIAAAQRQGIRSAEIYKKAMIDHLSGRPQLSTENWYWHGQGSNQLGIHNSDVNSPSTMAKVFIINYPITSKSQSGDEWRQPFAHCTP